MNVREYIEQFLIKEIGELVENHPFQAFTLMATGIEFLGKCLNENEWDTPSQGSSDFNSAIEKLDHLVKYKEIKNLYDKLRCGLAHLCVPKAGIELCPNHNELKTYPIILGCRDFYEDFKEACNEIINDPKQQVKKKMDEDFVKVVENSTSTTISSSSLKTLS